MQDFTGKNILIGVCGSIAAYKSPYLVRECSRLGAKVRVVMTRSALQFITPLTFQALSDDDVRVDAFDASAERAMSHIELARWADYLIIAPASANCLAKLAHGLADDLLSTLYLVTQAQVYVCPAMNRVMWEHKATQENCNILRQRGVFFIGPDEGLQACGEEGFGRMSEVPMIINALRIGNVQTLLVGRHVLITAGPTVEAIDPVRYLSNHSSGKMGYALAQAAFYAGARVTLISGPTALSAPFGVTMCSVNSAAEMTHAVQEQLQRGDIFISAAAVADYSPETIETEKIKKNQQQDLTLSLKPNIDILSWVTASGKASYVVGFAAETSQLLIHAQAKFEAKGVDMLVANEVGEGRGFNREENQVTVLLKNKQIELPSTHKMHLAGQIIAILASNLQNEPSQLI